MQQKIPGSGAGGLVRCRQDWASPYAAKEISELQTGQIGRRTFHCLSRKMNIESRYLILVPQTLQFSGCGQLLAESRNSTITSGSSLIGLAPNCGQSLTLPSTESIVCSVLNTGDFAHKTSRSLLFTLGGNPGFPLVSRGGWPRLTPSAPLKIGCPTLKTRDRRDVHRFFGPYWESPV